MQRSLSFSRDVPGSSSVASKYRMPSTPKQPHTLRRSSKSKIAKPQLPQNWVDLAGEASLEKYSKEEIKRQEVCNQVCKMENTLCTGHYTCTKGPKISPGENFADFPTHSLWRRFFSCINDYIHVDNAANFAALVKIKFRKVYLRYKGACSWIFLLQTFTVLNLALLV